MSKSFLTDGERWRRRAEEMRTLGENMRDPTTKQILLRLAVDYDTMAERADQRNIKVDPAHLVN
ncbi:MAG: hypothetical protein JO310_15985 [Hyphomicrobiales bacterium]|nr:hypothetical protein [Hyphomicrobiales bacterium]